MNNDRRFEELKRTLFMWGHKAIEDFLGYKYPNDEEKDITNNRMDEVYMQMPNEEFDAFCKKFNIT